MARQSLHRSYRLQHFNLMVVLYTFPSFLKSPLITAIFFLFFTILSMLFFFLFRGMAYCKYIYPIGSVNTAFARTSPVWLSTYEEECKSCKKPDCALACPYELNPSKFEERKSMMYCTMCMECAHTTRFLHGLSRTALSEYMPWVIVGNYLQKTFGFPKWVDMTGLVAMLMALSLVLFLVWASFTLIAKITGKSFREVLLTLGYAFAPLMIVGGLSHVLEFFFIEYYHNIVNGFSQAFGLGIHAEPLAKRGDHWLRIFRIFPFIAGFWSMYILWRRTEFIGKYGRLSVFLVSSILPVVYILLSLLVLVGVLFFPAQHFHRH